MYALRDIRMYVAQFDVPPAVVRMHMEAATEILAVHEPWLLACLARNDVCSWVSGTRGAPYMPLIRVIDIPAAQLMTDWPEYAAAIVIHEATHAPLRDRGVRVSRDNRHRVEGISRDAERRLVESLHAAEHA